MKLNDDIRKQMKAAGDKALSEEDLGRVSGGTGGYMFWVCQNCTVGKYNPDEEPPTTCGVCGDTPATYKLMEVPNF